MLEIKKYEDVILFCKAMASPLRASIVELLSTHDQMNLQELAKALGVTNGALTAHIKMLSKAGIIRIENANGIKGLQKLCSLQEFKYLLHLNADTKSTESYEIDIPVGSYSRYDIHPTCGLATPEKIIGYFDNPVFFDDPQRIYASMLWFYSGYVEYHIPNYLNKNQHLTRLSISHEICSEAPGSCEDWPSDIHFSINGTDVGFWTSPADFGSHKGIYTPEWWPQECNQYGLLKTLSITDEGTFIDHIKISDRTLNDLNLDYGKSIKYRLYVPQDAANVGGLTLLGKGFGNYNQNINVVMDYETMEKSK